MLLDLRGDLAGQLAELEVVDLDVRAVDRHLADQDRHDHQRQVDAAGDHRRPEDAALVLPEFAPEQPLHGVHRIVGSGGGGGRGVHA
ncbi:MAG: hypothetical protein LKM39_03755 [Chiayiivirga sp.]|jgi:hypothetical protein|nr:hypothetical protein [Chiayiivirga sp.]